VSAVVARIDEGGVAELRLERPQRRNALTTELLAELRDHLAAVAGDPSCGAVLLTGAGAGFCAGADVDEFAPGAPADGPLKRIRLVAEVLRRIGALEQPTVAAVHGAAVGAGWGLALACDVCLAAQDASFSLPELAKGYRIPEPLMARLVAVAGPVRAADLAFSGRVIDAGEAAAAGCVARVAADHDEVVAAARDLCRALATHPPHDLIWTEE
jgi:enoyl-CoA hydratase/carnithine racemase